MLELSRSQHKARREHKCIWCEDPIEVGQQYERSSWSKDGGLQDQKEHIKCSQFVSDHVLDFGFYDECPPFSDWDRSAVELDVCAAIAALLRCKCPPPAPDSRQNERQIRK